MKSKAVHLTLLLLVTLALAHFSSLYIEARGSTADQTSAEQLDNARRANEEAQAEYYREQVKLLKSGNPQKTLWQNISDNPASALGVVGAVIVALVTLVSFLLNYRVSLNNQMDTQFYEALRRFGDKDSPAVRASAAGIIAQMANVERRRFNLRHPVNSLRTSDQIYFLTSRNQLVTGLLLELNTVALLSIRDAMHQVVEISPAKSLEMVFRANQYLSTSTLNSLVEYFISLGAKDRASINKDMRSQAAFWTMLEPSTLDYIIEQESDTVEQSFGSRVAEYEAVSDKKRGEHRIEKQNDVSKKFFRLRLVVNLYSRAFRKYSLSAFTIDYGPLFLVNADLFGANLQSADLRFAVMSGANLQKANLTGANLSGAWMRKANLTGAKLYGARITEWTEFESTNWWAADYCDRDNETVDLSLLQELYDRYHPMPSDAAQIHPSVSSFLASHKSKSRN